MKYHPSILRAMAAIYGGTNYGFEEPPIEVVAQAFKAHPIEGISSHAMRIWADKGNFVYSIIDEAQGWYDRMIACPPADFDQRFPRAASLYARFQQYEQEKADAG